MSYSAFSKNRTWGKLALITLVSFLAGCGGTTHTIQTNGNEGMSLGNGEYLFPDSKGGLRAGKLLNPKGQPPAGTIIINPKSKTDVLEWLKRIGVKTDGKPIDTEAIDGADVDNDGNPIPQETKVK